MPKKIFSWDEGGFHKYSTCSKNGKFVDKLAGWLGANNHQLKFH
jgi:hypothetical protein